MPLGFIKGPCVCQAVLHSRASSPRLIAHHIPLGCLAPALLEAGVCPKHPLDALPNCVATLVCRVYLPSRWQKRKTSRLAGRKGRRRLRGKSSPGHFFRGTLSCGDPVGFCCGKTCRKIRTSWSSKGKCERISNFNYVVWAFELLQYTPWVQEEWP